MGLTCSCCVLTMLLLVYLLAVPVLQDLPGQALLQCNLPSMCCCVTSPGCLVHHRTQVVCSPQVVCKATGRAAGQHDT
jgi:hypothetical protein